MWASPKVQGSFLGLFRAFLGRGVFLGPFREGQTPPPWAHVWQGCHYGCYGWCPSGFWWKMVPAGTELDSAERLTGTATSDLDFS